MSTFEMKWGPQALTDLVFEDDTLRDYVTSCITANRVPDNLLLWGAAGTGKTMISNVLAKHFTQSSTAMKPYLIRIDETESEADMMRKISGAFSDNGGGIVSPGWILFDEFDRIAKSQERLKVIMDKKTDARLFATTNKIDKIEQAMRDRFRMWEVKLPTPEQFLPRAKLILDAELPNKKMMSDDTILRGLRKPYRDGTGSLRQMMRSIHDAILYLQGSNSINPWK